MAEPYRREREEPKPEAPKDAAQKAAEAPNPHGPPGEGSTNPDLLTTTEIVKAEEAQMSDEDRARLERFAAKGKRRMTRYGTRFQIVGPGGDGGGVFVVKLEDSDPKNVLYLSEPQNDEYLDDEG